MYFEGFFFYNSRKISIFQCTFLPTESGFPLLLHLKIQIIYQSFNTNYV